ncbi:MAG: response regulator [Bacteroidales bacterium]|nr:response regulator [Bacteroidales bacterium]
MSIQNRKILIVEDDEMNFIYLSQIFKIAKITIVRAKTGYEAIDITMHDPEIDLILMDIQLPDISGIEVTEKIRNFNRHLPIIAQTATKSDHERDAILNAGCTDFLVKPFKMDELLAKIREYLS